MSVRYILDTHAVVFLALNPGKLGRRTSRVIEAAHAGELGISPATVATALDLGVPLITKDGNITDSGVVRVVLVASSGLDPSGYRRPRITTAAAFCSACRRRATSRLAKRSTGEVLRRKFICGCLLK